MQAAPGIDNFMLAPGSGKYWQETRSSAALSLNSGPIVKVAIDRSCKNWCGDYVRGRESC